ncbi:MAG: tetratricopeptide repeat protein, partial [Thermoflexibacteraceae bacterium]
PIAITYYEKSLALKEELKVKPSEIGTCLNSLGNSYRQQGNYPLALITHQRALKIREELNDEESIASSLNNIGLIFKAQGDNRLALEYFNKSLKIKEKIKDLQGIAVSCNNIGNIYKAQKQYDLALSTLERGLRIRQELKDKKGEATTFNNIGDLYIEKGDDSLALLYYNKGLSLKEEIKDITGIVSSLEGISEIYQRQKKYKESIIAAEKALKMSQEINTQANTSVLAHTLYEVHKSIGAYDKALIYHELYKASKDSLFNVDKAKAIANLESKMVLDKKEKEIALLAKDNELSKVQAEKQARELEITKKQAEADQLVSLASEEKDKRKADSLYAEAQQARLEAENLKTKEEKIKLEQEKQQLAHVAELEQQKRIRNTFLGISLTFLLVIVFVIVGYYQKQKSNRLLAQQNNEIKRQQQEIAEKNDELSQANEELYQQQEELKVLNENLAMQKQEVEDTYTQLKSTSDALGKSINYASNIQSIILADANYLKSFFQDVFIVYLPRDVVSGDFYWFSKISSTQAVFVLADCTGHGVPGAFMSMLGSTLLDEIINQRKLFDSPAAILMSLHQRLHTMLKQNEGRNTDGMDISIAYVEKQADKHHVVFAGAKTSMYYTEQDELLVLQGDRTYLGGKNPQAVFTDKKIMLAEHSVLYFFSDGIADQNNAERQKFGSKNFQLLLKTIHQQPLEVQKNIILSKLKEHQGKEPQRDDISLVGLSV